MTATATVVGAGAWGSTLADVMARAGVRVRLWDRSPEALERLRTDRRPFGVPELCLHESVVLEPSLGEAVRGAGHVIVVIPSQAIGGFAAELARVLDGANPVMVLASKGIDIETLLPLSEVLSRGLPSCPVAVISGPCIAREVAQRVPTSVVAACTDIDAARRVRDLVSTPSLRVYTQRDLLGVELGGALKNVIAIAAGIGDGLGFGANSKSALMARGLAEMARLAVAMGASARTVYGLAGLGDLAVTCFSPHSRNRTFGEHLGRGLAPTEARKAIGMVVEGEPTARAAQELARRHSIEMPITEAVVHLCEGSWSPREAVENLMMRELKEE